MEFQFRKASFGGFHRQDVVDYLEQTAKEHSHQVAELQARIAQMEEEHDKIAQLEAENERLQQACTAAQQSQEALQETLNQTETELAELRTAHGETEKELEQLKPDAQAYRVVKERAAGLELEAHVRAQKTIDESKAQAKALREEAQTQANKLRDGARQWAGQMKTQYSTSRGELDIAVVHAMEGLKAAQKNLDTLTQTMAQRDRALEQLVKEWTKGQEKK